MDRIARTWFFPCAFIVLVSLLTVFFRLGSLPLIGADEPRYARIAQEMLHDHQWVTPTLEFKPWLEKPPLYYWITVPFYGLFGTNEATARLGPAFLSLLSSLTVFWLGARLWSRPAGFMAALILISTLGFAGFARGASTDMPMTACLTFALALFAVAGVEKDFAAWKILPAYFFLGLSVLAKGPVALALIAGILLLFWLFDERGGSFRRWHVISGLAIAAAVSLPWFWLAFRENGFAFIATFFINHNVARYVSDIHHHTEPPYYYFPVLLGMFFPWSAWFLLLVPHSIRSELSNWRIWNPATLFMMCWITFPLLFFSISQSKLSGYILPILPPLALLLGAGWAKAISGEAAPRLRASAAGIYLLFSAGIAIAAPLVFQKSYGGAWETGLILSGVVLGPALFGCYAVLKRRWRTAFAVTLIQGVAVILAVALFAFPILGRYQSTREIARQALECDQKEIPIVTLFFFHHTLNYYTGYSIAANFDDMESLVRFGVEHRRFLVIVEEEHAREVERLYPLNSRIVGSQGDLRLIEVNR
ncbi:MAG TPA: glycosyltransferase family 39 protein [Acidobacteriota bacterium]|nr:glycosyltransferase family 39 protein [Acidobacteriota bacterium]